MTPKTSQTSNVEPESTDSIGRLLQTAQDELAEAGSLFRKNTKAIIWGLQARAVQG